MPNKLKITEPLSGLKGCFVAGGAVTSLYTNAPINDFDVYPKSEDALITAIQWAYDNNMWCADMSNRAMTMMKGDTQVQIMHFDVFPTPEHIFEAFDFTCCMGAFDLDDEQFKLHPLFLEHCSQRFLSFNKGTRFPYASAWRVNKYKDKGFTIGKVEYQKILLACAARPITSWEGLKEQMGGVYGEAITIPEGVDFSPEAMWSAVETLTFKAPEGGPADADEAIVAVSSKPIPVFKNDGNLYADYTGSGEYYSISREPKNPVWKTIGEAIGTTFYKKVLVKGGRYFGPHRKDFEYIVGSVTHSPAGPGLFVYQSKEKAKGHNAYANGDFAVLELSVADPDDIVFGGEIKLKKATVVAVHELTDIESEAAA